MPLEDYLLRAASSAKKSWVKYLFYAAAVIFLFIIPYIVGYMNQKGMSDYQSSKGPIVVIISTLSGGFVLMANFIKDIALSETVVPQYLFIIYLLTAFLVGYSFSRIKTFLKVAVQNIQDKFTRTGEVIFEDNFSTDTGWHLKYWENENQKDINYRIRNGMVFKASPEDITNREGRYGAYRDFPNLSSEGAYKLTAWVKSEKDSTMKFQLWLHNDVVGRGSSWTKREPANAFTPSEKRQKISTNFTITQTRSLRVHLEATPGIGKIIVEKIRLEHII